MQAPSDMSAVQDKATLRDAKANGAPDSENAAQTRKEDAAVEAKDKADVTTAPPQAKDDDVTAGAAGEKRDVTESDTGPSTASVGQGAGDQTGKEKSECNKIC